MIDKSTSSQGEGKKKDLVKANRGAGHGDEKEEDVGVTSKYGRR